MHKYQQVFSNVVKSVRPTYGNKEELAPLNQYGHLSLTFTIIATRIFVVSYFLVVK